MGANLAVTEGQEVAAGDVLAKMPRETTKTKDITGGLPRVAELFEARKPKDFAIVSEIDGTISFGPDSRGKRRVIATPDLAGAESLGVIDVVALAGRISPEANALPQIPRPVNGAVLALELIRAPWRQRFGSPGNV